MFRLPEWNAFRINGMVHVMDGICKRSGDAVWPILMLVHFIEGYHESGVAKLRKVGYNKVSENDYQYHKMLHRNVNRH